MHHSEIIPDPPIALAPLAGISDLPFRDIALKYGAGLVVSEMIASHDIVHARQSTQAKAELGFDRTRTAVQIAGREAYWMAEAAKLIEGQGAKRIDINMGCPAKKVTSGQSGAALMRNEDHAISLIEAVVGATTLPVTLKMRLGWDDSNHNAPSIAAKAQNAGVRMITVHGRTRCQFYKGHANWKAVRNVVQAVDIPVIVNGDIIDPASAKTALQHSGAAGVMVGRGTVGQPWIIQDIAAQLRGQATSARPDLNGLITLMIEHFQAMVEFYGPKFGIRNARKHLSAYLLHFNVPKDYRHKMLTETDDAAVLQLIYGLDHFGLCDD